jgi:hypothetical protein
MRAVSSITSAMINGNLDFIGGTSPVWDERAGGGGFGLTAGSRRWVSRRSVP